MYWRNVNQIKIKRRRNHHNQSIKTDHHDETRKDGEIQEAFPSFIDDLEESIQSALIRFANNIRNEGKSYRKGEVEGLNPIACDLESSKLWKACSEEKGLQKL